jgi:hypothetical protein
MRFDDGINSWIEGWSELSDAEGRTSVRARPRGYTRQEGRDYRVFVASDVPEAGATEVEVDEAHPPSDPVRLVIGDTGRAVVRVVDLDGRPVMEKASVSLVVAKQRSSDPELPRPCQHPLVAGEARFERVGVGARLTASAHLPDHRYVAQQEADGPKRPGDEVVIVIKVDTGKPFITGRILDPDGRPLNAPWVPGVIRSGEKIQGALTLPLDAGSRFRIEIVEALVAGQRPRLDLEVSDSGLVLARGMIDLSRSLPAGDTDVGDVRLERVPLPPLIGAGTVVDERGAPVERARLNLEKLEPADPPRRPSEGYARVGGVTYRSSDPAGKFEIRGACDAKDLRLSASKDGYWGANPVRIEPGAKDVVLRVHRGASLEGSLVQAAEGPTDSKLVVRAILEADDGEQRSQGAEGWGAVRRDGSFGVSGLRAGAFTVTLQLERELFILAEVRGVKLEAGETTRDPRLQKIDCSGFGTVTITAVDAAGGILHGAQAAEIADAPVGRNARRAVAGEQGTGAIKLWVRRRPTDVKVGAMGYRPQIARAVGSDRRVVLEKGIPIRVVLSDPVEVPHGVFASLDLEAEAVAAESPELAAPDLVACHAGASVPKSTRELKFRMSEPGRYRARIRLLSNQSRFEDVMTDRLLIQESDVEQKFDFVVSPDAVEKAVRRLGAK